MSKAKRGVEPPQRSALKSATFRITIIISDTIITFALTHRYDITIGFVVFTNVASTLIYYFHERVWAHVNWGRSGGKR